MSTPVQLDSFDIQSMTALEQAIRECAEGLTDLGEAAQKISATMDEMIRMPGTDAPGLALSRLYITRRFGQLDKQQADFALNLAGCNLEAKTACLVLAGSSGRKQEWCEPRQSRGHLAIPLLSVETVESLPMVHRLFEQLGVDVEALLMRQLILAVKLRKEGLGVFHVEEASRSPWVPGQEFVCSQGVKSCIANGGVLPDGEVFTLLLFSKAPISEKAAIAFRPLALSIEIALLPYLGFHKESEAESTILAFRRLLAMKDSFVARNLMESHLPSARIGV
jgi:hypothetical protein